MKQRSLLFILLFFNFAIFAQTGDDINLDEQKVKPYQLPDVLLMADGKPVRTLPDWMEKRRPEILSLYQQHVYGKMPGKPTGMHFRVNFVNDTALNNTAICKQVTVFFTEGTTGPSMDVLLYVPQAAGKPVPVFTGFNFYGNHTTTFDTTVPLTQRWVMNNGEASIRNNKAGESSRGLQKGRWPVEMLIGAGYGLATAYYGDLEPDHDSGWKEGVRGLLAAELGIMPDEWSAIGAWAWGLSRMVDYLETEPGVNAKKIILTGHSRLGKAALWAAANDQRFAAVVSNNSGEGGAALFRRNFGETILRINTSFPHWFVPAFKAYNSKPDSLPVDQHMLLSLVAPRPLYVASAAEDLWADPKGEFLAALHTTPVYSLFARKGLGVTEMPAVNEPVGATVRYHIRSGKHDITPYDWEQYIRFANETVR